jgi:hypothetical protein
MVQQLDVHNHHLKKKDHSVFLILLVTLKTNRVLRSNFYGQVKKQPLTIFIVLKMKKKNVKLVYYTERFNQNNSPLRWPLKITHHIFSGY